MGKFLWKFHWDCDRMGDVTGLFVATEAQVDKLIGKQVYFGDIFGKHSEVYGIIEKGEINKVDVSPSAVEEVTKVLGNTWSGYNPMGYLKDDEDEEDLK